MTAGCPLRLPLSLIMLVALTALAGSSCGRKSEPSLKAYEKPQPVREVRAVQREEEFVLTWTYPKSDRGRIRGFQLERSEGAEAGQRECASFKGIGLVSAKQSEFADRDLRKEMSYCYRIFAESNRGVMSDPSPELVVSLHDLPQPPTELSYQVHDDAIDIEWQPLSGVRYFVYRSFEKAKVPLTPIHDTPLTEPRYRDSVHGDRTVYYYVRSVIDVEVTVEGPLSGALEVRPETLVPSGPRGLQYVPLSGGVQLHWTENPEAWVAGYRVYRKRPTEPGFSAIGDTVMPAFRDNEPLSVRTSYYVTARGPVKESVPSSAVQATPVEER